MIRTSLAILALIATPAIAMAQSDEDRISASCTEAGNEEAACDCAAEALTEALTDDEMNFMMATMDADTSDPNAVLALTVEHNMTMESMMALGQKVSALEPVLRDECGVEEFG